MELNYGGDYESSDREDQDGFVCCSCGMYSVGHPGDHCDECQAELTDDTLDWSGSDPTPLVTACAHRTHQFGHVYRCPLPAGHEGSHLVGAAVPLAERARPQDCEDGR